MGCFGMIVVILFLATFAWIVYRVTAVDMLPDGSAKWNPHSESTTLESQLAEAGGKHQKITQVRLVNVPLPVDGLWEIKDVGFEVVVLEGAAGKWVVRCDQLAGFLVAGPASAPLKTVEPQLEK